MRDELWHMCACCVCPSHTWHSSSCTLQGPSSGERAAWLPVVVPCFLGMWLMSLPSHHLIAGLIEDYTLSGWLPPPFLSAFLPWAVHMAAFAWADDLPFHFFITVLWVAMSPVITQLFTTLIPPFLAYFCMLCSILVLLSHSSSKEAANGDTATAERMYAYLNMNRSTSDYVNINW